MAAPLDPPPAGDDPSRRRRLLAGAAVAVLGLIAGSIAAEVAVRLSGAAPEVALIRRGRFQLSPNPKIGYEPVPGLEYHGPMDSFHDYAGRSNSLGFRDREHAVAKPPGVFRVLVLGDSVAAGQGVADFENTYPAVLERELRRLGVEAEVLSFAVTGYNTQQEVETLADKGLAYRPDLVLVAYCLNDRKRSDGGVLPQLLESEGRAEGLVSSRLDPRLAKSALYRFLRFRLAGKDEPPPPTVGDTRDAAFARLAELADRHGFRALVAVFPRIRRLQDYRWIGEHEEVQELVGRHGLAHLDLLAAFQDCDRAGEGALGADSIHPSASGHRCAAAATARYVQANLPALGG